MTVVLVLEVMGIIFLASSVCPLMDEDKRLGESFLDAGTGLCNLAPGWQVGPYPVNL